MAFIDKYEIRQGKISLYRRTNEGGKYAPDSWYCAIKIRDKKTIRRSLKTNIQSEAEALAEDLWFDLTQRNSRGLSLSTKRFELVARGYIKDLIEKTIQDSKLPKHEQVYKTDLTNKKQQIVERYLIPYFSDKNLQDITDRDIASYPDWRRNYWLTGEGSKLENITYIRNNRTVKRPKSSRETKAPKWSTINKELTVIRHIYEFAQHSNIIEGREIPTIRNVKKPKTENSRKSGLTEKEVKLLLSTLVKRYKAQTNPKHKNSHKLLIHYISWMALTGMRVSEVKNIRISDCKRFVKNKKEYLKVFVHGKGKMRELVGQEEALIVLDKLIYLHKTSAKLKGWTYEPDMYLFSDQYGKAVKSFANGLDRALEEAGLLYDSYGVKRSGGTFRKYYITHALLVGNVNYFELAKQTGTSVSVIEKYYAEINPTERPELYIFKNALSGVYDDNPANEHK